MYTKSKSRSRLWIFIALPFVLYTLFNVMMGGLYVLAVMSSNYMDDHTLYCSSRAEAKAAGVFMDTVLVEPRVVRYGGYEITFEDCWLEQLRNSHRPSWDARREVTKQPRAIFNFHYRATYHGRPISNADKSPVLYCEGGLSGQFLGQEPYQHGEVYIDLGPDDALNINLPLHFSLQQDSAQIVISAAYPGSAKR